jgi:RND family efflux transporter MFP subunit
MRTLRWLLILLVLGGAGAFAWWRAVGQGPLVGLVSPRRGVAAEIVYATGVVEPERWAKVSPMTRKRVVDMCFCEGREVKKGEVLARLDDGEEKAGLAELEATRERRKRDVERISGLAARAAATQLAVDQAETLLAEIEARIAAQKDRIGELTLRAPLDGQVLRRDGQIGEIVGQNDVLFWVGPPDPRRIVAEVNEEDILKVAVGQTALLRADALGEGRIEAKVGAITPKGDPASKTFRVYLPLPQDSPLRIGMSVEANIVAREKQNALTIPPEALAGSAVYLYVDGLLRKREVKIGLRGARGVEIVEGLSEADHVVSPAKPEWKDGARARIAPAGEGR